MFLLFDLIFRLLPLRLFRRFRRGGLCTRGILQSRLLRRPGVESNRGRNLRLWGG